MINYKSENDNFFKADEQYILCIANCTGTKLDKTREPLTTQLFTKFPEANIYKERLTNPSLLVNGKAPAGSLIIKGKLAIILGLIYPGTKEYANDSKDFRLKWFREGLQQLQKMLPRSIAIRENFTHDIGGDWNQYLYHLNEMDKSIKISIYPHVIPIPLFNIVRFRSDNGTKIVSNQPIGPLGTIGPKDGSMKPVIQLKTPILPLAIQNKIPNPTMGGFGKINVNKLMEEDEVPNSTEPAKRTLRLPIIMPKIPTMPKTSQPELLRSPILPIKIENTDLPINTVVQTEVQIETQVPLVPMKAEVRLPDGTSEVIISERTIESEKSNQKKYIANPDWEDLSTFNITGWDEIINDPILAQKREAINVWFKEKELPKFGDYFKIYPPQDQIFNSFNLCPFKDIKLVIVGQDCYINEGEAMGLAFSVAKGVKIPPSLRNIYKELSADIPGFKEPNHGSLISWANQGVFLINSALTVREGVSGSHLEIWQPFTDMIISYISQNKKNLVFILWGNPAKKKLNVIKNIDDHCIITAAHPSPLSASKGFFGSKCFSQANAYLEGKGLGAIDWSIPE